MLRVSKPTCVAANPHVHHPPDAKSGNVELTPRKSQHACLKSNNFQRDVSPYGDLGCCIKKNSSPARSASDGPMSDFQWLRICETRGRTTALEYFCRSKMEIFVLVKSNALRGNMMVLTSRVIH